MATVPRFHPLVAGWFANRFAEATDAQRRGWEEIASGRNTLLAAPTGSGKTLAAFLWSINRLVERAVSGELADRTQILYISPLKALGNDIERNLQEPLRGIRERASAQGVELPEIRVAVRSGDTSSADRSRMVRKPPHILITTPESLFILLTAERSREFLATAETVIVDEIHAVAGDKRGSHLALSLERLDALAGRPLQRIGLSATQRPIEQIAALLTGSRDCAIVDVGHRRPMYLSIHVPERELGPIATHELWAEAYEHILQQVQRHRTTIVFVNTRRQVERVAHQLGERLGAGRVAAHHGSLSKETRLAAEGRLKSGEVPVVVATASLELGIDIGHVELVCLVGAPRNLATLLQRVGRSGHWLGAVPKGILYPLTRDDLVQCAAAVRAVGNGDLDRTTIPHKPLDILAQQIVAIAATGEIGEDELFALVTTAYPFRDLAREEFDQVIEMLSEGIATGRGRRSAYLHRDRVHGLLRPRRGARLRAITCGGAIPDVADYDVVEEPTGTLVGRVHEDFAMESMAGDIFLLGNQSWRIRRVEAGRVRVEDAQGAPPTVPFWLGEAPARSLELSAAVGELRQEVADRLSDLAGGIDSLASEPWRRRQDGPAEWQRPDGDAAGWLQAEVGLDEAGAEQIADYVAETVSALGAVPTQHAVVAERFFDEAGGMQLVLHSPFGARINRAWGMALRKRFCVTFDTELQAAATDDGIVISLGERHSFPLDAVFRMVAPAALEEHLTQAAIQSPMFTNRWRWNANRALAVLRHEGGRRVPMNIQRMRADDLLAAVFPDQVACQDNRGGPIVPPDHPLVTETVRNCLHEAMDLEGLRDILHAIGRGDIRTLAVETSAPSPMSHEILNANPYAFLDDAPLEERRARAVPLRRTDPDLARGIGALDPEAIALVRSQAWPDVRDAEELHDLLLTLGVLPLEEVGEWRAFADELIAAGRAAIARFHDRPLILSPSTGSGQAQSKDDRPPRSPLVAAERLQMVEAACGPLHLAPPISQPAGIRVVTREDALTAIVGGWLEVVGPTTAEALSDRIGLAPEAIEGALGVLEARGIVLRGHFTTGGGPGTQNSELGTRDSLEWCERRLLARIHRLTLGRLHQEIEAVNVADFIRYLVRWQHVAPGSQLHGREGVAAVVKQLQGLELPAPAWEEAILPARLASYDPADLEHLCLAGVVTWGRLSPRGAEEAGIEVRRGRRHAPTRQAAIAFLLRDDLPYFLHQPEETEVGAMNRAPTDFADGLSPEAHEVASYLLTRGASFLPDIARGTRHIAATVEDALWELVARGLVSGDGIAGLRALLQPEFKRRRPTRHLQSIRGGRSPGRTMPTGRWSLWGADGLANQPWRRPQDGPAEWQRPDGDATEAPTPDARAEFFARQFLQRYGVVLREVLARESQAPPWRMLLRTYRQMEARGEIRGGRFVAGFVGEQYALPEAVEALRAVRRTQGTEEIVLVAAADPLNLVGILTPGGRVSPYSNQTIAYRDGAPADIGALGAVRSRLQLGATGRATARWGRAGFPAAPPGQGDSHSGP